MKTERFIFIFGIAAVLLAACASATQQSVAPINTAEEPATQVIPTPFPDDMPVLIWSRAGGIAGFCDGVTVLAGGAFKIEDCKDKPAVRSGQLDAGQLAQLADWVNTFKSFEDGDDNATPAYPDQMFVKTIFTGNGSTQASPEDKIAINDFAATLTVKTGPVGAGETPEAAIKARDFLAKELGLSADEITIVSAEATEWPDACLGLAQPDEMCAEMLVSGYKVILEAKGQSYELRTDLVGESIRRVP